MTVLSPIVYGIMSNEQLANELLGLMIAVNTAPEEKVEELKEAFTHNVKLAKESNQATDVLTGILDLSDLDKYELIEALWQNARVASFFFIPEASVVSVPKGPTREEIDAQMRRGDIDYLNGRAIKTDFSDMSKIDTEGYDSRSHKGAFGKVVTALRKK